MTVNSNIKNTEQTDWIRSAHTFAEKWLKKFKDDNINYIELVDHYFADDCAELGFEMDCGNAFSEKYGAAVNDSTALKQIIDTVDDISLLGSAVYSQWRYLNHWAYSGEEILEQKNREWFIVALNRMALLSEDKLKAQKAHPALRKRIK